MTDKIFFYHFRGGSGAEGAVSRTIAEDEPSVSTEYGYLTTQTEIPELEDHLKHIAEFDEGLSTPRDFDRDLYKTATNNMEDLKEYASDTDFMPAAYRIEDFDILHALSAPTDGFATAGGIGSGPRSEENLHSSHKKDILDGRVERVSKKVRAAFYTNNLSENEITDLEQFIRSI